MDYDKLIDRLNTKLQSYASYTDSEFAHVIEDAVLAIETLRAENEKLRKERDEARVDCAVAEKNHANCTADLARVTAERDGAIEDLEEIMFKGRRNIDTCEYCKNAKCYGRGGIQVCNPVWRGIKEED